MIKLEEMKTVNEVQVGEVLPSLEEVIESTSFDNLIDLQPVTIIVENWLSSIGSIETKKYYFYVIEDFFKLISKHPIQIKKSDIDKFIIHMQRRSLAKASLKRNIAVIKSFFSFCQKSDFTLKNVSLGVNNVVTSSVEHTTNRIIEITDLFSMINKEKSLRNKTMLRLLLTAMLRNSEVRSLTWGQLRKHGSGGYYLHGVVGKSKDSRSIRLDKVTSDMLLEYKQSLSFFFCKDTDFIFMSRQRKQMTSQQLIRIVKASAKRAGISYSVCPHGIRHTGASAFYEQTKDIFSLQKILGHQNISTTQVYLHLSAPENAGDHIDNYYNKINGDDDYNE